MNLRNYIQKQKPSKSNFLFVFGIVVTTISSISSISYAQTVASYAFSQSNGVYTPITGGSVLVTATGTATSTDASLDQGNYTVSIPFNFAFNGTTYTSCNANANGYITFGATLPATSLTTPISTATAYNGVAAAMAKDLWGVFGTGGTRTNGSAVITGVSNFTGIAIGKGLRGTGIPTTATVSSFNIGAGTITMSVNATATSTTWNGWPNGELRAQTIGVAPNRTVVIQWSGMSDFVTATPNDGTMEFQIRLNEGGGIAANQTIDIVYGSQTNLNTTARTNQVGLRGATTADFNNRSSATDWNATTLGGVNTASVTRTNLIFPASGLTYTWTPPNICAGTPAPGNTLSTLNPVCSGTNFTLSLQNNPVVLGLTYQWQSSLSNFVSDSIIIGGATNPTYTTSQAVSTYYRCKVSCTNSGLFNYSNSLQVVVPVGFSGTYTINSALPTSGSNFQTFAAAIAAISCGISGPVVFNVNNLSGPYNEQVIIPAIGGTSATNTITFNGNGRTIAYNTPVTGERAVVKLNGTDFVTFDNFIISCSSASFGFGVQLLNDADNNTISNCNITVDQSSTSTVNFAGIVINSSATSVIGLGASLCDNNVISGNTITGGYAGISIAANGTTSMVNNNQVINNIVRDFQEYGIFINGNSNCLVEGNDISRPTRSTVTTFRGIGFNGVSLNSKVSKNRLHNPFGNSAASTAAAFCIYFINCDATLGNENIVSNNLIYDHIGSTGNHNGVLNVGSDYVKYYHNTIVLNDVNATCTACAARGFYQQSPIATGLEYVNNIVTISQGGTAPKQAMYFEGTPSSSFISDHNNFYISSAGGSVNNVGFVEGLDYVTLTDWQIGTEMDSNSVSVYPGYTFPGGGNYAPTSPLLDNTGTNVGILTDILGASRSVSTPDPGAYEFTPMGLDATISWISPVPPAVAGSYTVTVNIFNSLVTTINSLTLAYTDGFTTQSQNFTGLNILSAANQNFSFSVPFNLTGSVSLRAYISSVNGGSDLNQTNDTTIAQNLCLALAGGTYTINSAAPTSGSNFNSFTDAVAALNCGITGPVVFNVNPTSGPYNEQISIPVIGGASATNTVVFNGNGRTIQFASTNTNARAVIKLNGADYVTIDSLTINFSGGTFGWGIHFINQADHNTISKCILNGDQTGTATASFIGIVLSGSNTSSTTAGNSGNYNTITGCTLNYSAVGISIYGTSAAPYITDNKILNNNIRDFYTWGIYSQANENTVISGNIIERPTRTTVGAFFGMDILSNTRNLLIEKNIIRNPCGGAPSNTGSSICMYLSNGTVPVGMEPRIINNLIYNMNGLGAIYGIYLTTSPTAKVYHNTVSMDETTSTSTMTAYGIYIITSATAVDVKNNIVTISRGGTGQKACIYVSPAANVTINNNVLFMNAASGTTNYVGYYSPATTGYPTLASWQTANGGIYDLQSSDMNPLYTNPGIGNYIPAEPLINNIGANVGVIADFNGAARTIATPDPGAFEFTPVGLDAGIAWVSPATNVSPGSYSIVVNISNNKTDTITSLDLSYAVGLSTVNQSFTGLNLLPFTSQQFTFTTPYNITGFTSFTAYISGVNGIADDIQSNDTTKSKVCIPLSGNYTIDATLFSGGGNFNSFNEAVEALICSGVTGTVTFNVATGSGPYNEQIVIPSISGVSSSSQITFNGNGETLTFNSTNTNVRAGIALNGADYITINNLVINATGSLATEYGYGVQLYNDADNNTISNCVININQTSTSSVNFAGILVATLAAPSGITTAGNSLCDNNSFSGNTIIGGYAGIALVANSATNTISNNKVTNNIIKDFYFSGVFLNGGINTLIEGNDISRPNRSAVTTFNGINLTNRSLKTSISKNKIHTPFGGVPGSTIQTNGILISACDATPGNENVISNNILYDLKSEGIIYPVNNTGSDYAQYYHNTIFVNDQTASTSTGFTRGFFQTTIATGLEYKNNIVYISRTSLADKHCIYFATAGTTFLSDHNDFYIIPAGGAVNSIGFANGVSYSTLTSWQSGTSQDANSASINPNFVNPLTPDLQPTESLIDNLGVYININEDINGSVRSFTTPDPGAYEFNISPCIVPPIAGLTASTDTSICILTNFTLSLFGNTSGAGQSYQWQSTTDGITWTDISGATTQFYTLQQTTSKYYRAIVNCGASADTSNPLLVNSPLPVSGIYTINSAVPTGGFNFQNFNDAVSFITCGIDGPVVFNVAAGSGPYNEQISIPAIPGTSPINTITFNGNGQTIQYASSNAALRAVIKLGGADYVTINNLVIDGSAGTYGWGVYLTNHSDHNTIDNCTIKVSTTSTTSGNHEGVVISNSSSGHVAGDNANFTMISNNTITGGYYGVVIYGNTSPNQTYGNTVVNNIIRDFYYYGIYNYGSDSSVISDNILERPNRTVVSSTTYGILVTTGCINMMIKNNHLRNLYGAAPGMTGTIYCLYNIIDGTPGNENNFINNIVSDINFNGTIYGLYLSGADYVNAYHNTISLDNTTATGTTTTYGIYSTGTVGGINIKNNNVTISRGGTGTKYCLYYSGGSQISNHNNLVNSSITGTNNIGYFGSAFATLSAWQAANGGTWDQQSQNLNPFYNNPAVYDYKPTNSALDNAGTSAGVSTDILGVTRNVTFPDIGAYEFDGTPCNGTPVAGTASALNTQLCAGGNNTTKLTLTGNSTFAGIELQWQQSLSSGGPYTNVTGGSGNNTTIYSTSPLSNNIYFVCRAICTFSNDTSYSNEVAINVTNPQVLTTTGASHCGVGSVTLQATASPGAIINWYSSSSGVNPVATGNSYVTPVIAATTDYYVTASAGGSNQVIGLSTNSAASGTFSQSTATDWPIRFNVFTSGTITQGYVYPTAAGTLTIALRNALSAVNLQTYTFVVAANQVGTKVLLPLNFAVVPGNYQLTNVTGGIGRYSTYTGSYPITASDGSISIIGSATSSTAAVSTTTYNTIFDLAFSSGCEGTRTPVTATINPSPALNSTISLSPVCSATNVSLNVTSSNSGYTFHWTPGNLTGPSQVVSPASTTYYIVLATDSSGGLFNGCNATDTLRVYVQPSGITVSAAPASLCASGSVTLSLNPSADYAPNSIQWQNSTDSLIYNDIPGATSSVYVTPVLLSTTHFRAKIKDGNNVICSEVYKTVYVTGPAITSTIGATRCGPGPVTVHASGSGGSTINWYAGSSGGSPIGSGSTFTSQVINSNTNFYVSASGGGGGTQVLGPTNLSIGTFASFTALVQYSLFTVHATTTVQSVDIFFSATGPYTLVIQDVNNANAVVFSYSGTATIASSSIAQVIPINASLPPGNYRIGFSVNPGVYRNSTGGVYPYSIPGVLSITGNTFDPVYYYFFYRWVVGVGCESDRVPVSVVVTPAPSITATGGPNVICAGSSTSLSAASTNSNYKYTWNPGNLTGSSVLVSPSASVVYTVAANDSVTGCQNLASVLIAVNQLPVVNPTASTGVLCKGDSVQLSTNAVIGTSYIWTPSAGLSATNISNPKASPSGNTTYSVSVTSNVTGCSASNTVGIQVTELPVSYIFPNDTFLCTGSIIDIVSRNNLAYSNGWPAGTFFDFGFGPTFDSTFQINGPGIYSSIVTLPGSMGGCTSVSPDANISYRDAPVLFVNAEPVKCFGTSTGYVSAQVFLGEAPYRFRYYNHAGMLVRDTITNLTEDTLFNIPATEYCVIVNDVIGSTYPPPTCYSDSVCVFVTQPDLLVATEIHSVIACNGNTSNVTINASGGTAPYTGTGSFVQSGGTQTYTVTDANGCIAELPLTITEPGMLAQSLANTFAPCAYLTGNLLNSVSGGTAPFSYIWSNSKTTASVSGLAAGTYTVTVTDSHGCTNSSTAVVSPPGAVVVNGTSTNLLCRGVSTGTITLGVTGGVPNYSYLWTGGVTTENRTDLAAGTYVVTVTDANGCTKTKSFTITQPATNLLINSSKTNIRCFGANGGVATASPTGGTAPYAYSWNTVPVQTTATISGLFAGTYTCVITDAVGCSKNLVIDITEPADIIVLQTQTNVTFPGGSNGTATVSASGGTPGFTYSWNTVPVKTTATVTGLTAGTYKCTVTDTKSCQKKLTFVITEPVARSLDDDSHNWKVLLQPNPTNGIVMLSFGNDAEEKFLVTLNDFTGRLMFNMEGKALPGRNEFVYDFTGYSKGVYFIKITTDHRSKMIRMVIQ